MNWHGYDEKAIEAAISYLVFNFNKSGTNSKPVVLHSMRVANILWSYGATQTSVMAAVLHDVLEDTAVTPGELAEEFGESICQIVQSLTFDKSSDNFAEKLIAAEKSFEQSKNIGIEAVVVRAADLIDNSEYYKNIAAKDLRKYVKNKFELFTNMCGEHLEGTDLGRMLRDAYERNVKVL